MLKTLRRLDRERGWRQWPESAEQRQFVKTWQDESKKPTFEDGPSKECIAAIDFRPTPEVQGILNELSNRYGWMGAFTLWDKAVDGMYDLTPIESAIWAAAYEIRFLLGHPADDKNERLAKLFTLLNDGVLRSLIQAWGGRPRP
jgi:hypothetical protein